MIKFDLKKLSYRLLHKKSTGNLLLEIREYPPQRRTIEILGRFYNLPFPYLIFLKEGNVDRNHLYAFSLIFAKSPIKSLHSEVYTAPLPNVFLPTGHICIGIQLDDNYGFDGLLNAFWQTAFKSYDYSGGDITALRKNYGSLKKWSELTIDEALKKLKYKASTKRGKKMSDAYCINSIGDFLRLNAAIQVIKLNGETIDES